MSDVNEKELAIQTQAQDVLIPFQLEASAVRGRFVRLDATLDEILGQHRYPFVVSRLLAQAAAMAAALGTALKFDGVFTIQTQTDGPVSRLVVDVTSEGAVRACAQFDSARVTDGANQTELLGKGHLVFTVDQKLSDERYQGVVALTGDSLVEAFQLYFRQSEQIPTGLAVAARRDDMGHWHAGCLMLQRMPREGGVAEEDGHVLQDTSHEDDWHRTMALMQTCTDSELTDPALAPETLLFRLFHEEGVRVYETKSFHHACRCSREKIHDVLASVPHDELAHMVQEDGLISVTCLFCAKSYNFKPEEITSP